jgi:lipopolysaccharide transport system ATP-binding protein
MTIVDIRKLGKKYQIGGEQKRYHTLRESLMATFRRSPQRREHWALQDVSFEVNQGDSIGIVGRNGAGKSTLLKILSRITPPTTGEIILNGRVASLLEVGTGFHQELSGRENIFLNGSILGMKSAEIRKRFDEIVDFAGVEKFIETPIKYYSSGMQLRLAFSVAAFLDPEILVIDEVLAVGDADFQKKCIGKMNEVSRSGRTLLFVSHDMNSVLSLCDKAVLLIDGKMKSMGKARDVVSEYALSVSTLGSYTAEPSPEGAPKIIQVNQEVVNEEFLQLGISVHTGVKCKVSFDFHVKDQLNRVVGFGSFGALDYDQIMNLQPGVANVNLKIDISQLASGEYILGIDLTQPNVELFDRISDCLTFEVDRKVIKANSRIMLQSWGYGSVCFPVHSN